MSYIDIQIKKHYFASVSILLLGLFQTVCAKTIQSTDSVLEMAALIETNYILPEVAGKVANRLRENIEAGKYSIYDDAPKELADVLSKEIRNYSHDDHMYVEYVAGKDKQENWIDEWLEKAPSNNFGIKKVEILKGNIGYLSISSFYPLDIAKLSIQAAMDLLKHTKGLILDLRENGGGDDTSTRAILATFLTKGHKPLLLIESRDSKKPMSIPHKLEWKRYSQQKKMVIIVNNRTFSAPESLAFSLQEVGRAIIVGSNSAGGAHMTDKPLKVSGGYEIGIPNKRPISKTTGKNWEGMGVTPDVKSSDLHAIEIALKQFDGQSN